MELYVGLDLHSRNTYIGIMDKSFNRVFKKRVPNHLEHILQTLDPFRHQIKGFVVECMSSTVSAGICNVPIQRWRDVVPCAPYVYIFLANLYVV